MHHSIVGHGRSEGDRVHVEDVDIYVQDVIHHVELMKNEHPHLPCFLFGHSMVAIHLHVILFFWCAVILSHRGGSLLLMLSFRGRSCLQD